MAELSGRTCLVTGATGFLGSFVVEKLVQSGARVRCLVRRSSRRDFLPENGTEFILGDVTEPSSLPSAVTDVDYVFHIAGLIKAPRPEDYFRVNYLGTINLLEACRVHRDRLQRVVVISSLAAAGPSKPGTPIVETSPCQPITPYGRSKLQAERAALAYRDQLPLTIIRPPTIYGPRDRETLLIFRAVALGLRPALPVRTEVSLVHAADLADGILLAATHPAAVGQTYFMSGDDVLSIDALLQQMALAVGRRGVEVPVPAWALRGAARAAETLRQLGMASLVFDRWKAEEILIGCWACSNTRAKTDLGFTPRVTVADGFADTVRWYRTMRWL